MSFRNFPLVKRCYSLFILLILCINTAGFYVYYALELQRIRSATREQIKSLPDDQLQNFRLTTSQYEDLKVGDDEIKIDGKMYDIARITFAGDEVWIYALHDEDEDNLLLLLSEILSKPIDAKSAIPQVVLNFLSLVFIPETFNFCVAESGERMLDAVYHFSIQAFDNQNESPPPRC